MYDVIVAGAGPSGSFGAKKCAEIGLKTLVLEKRQLPREKLCSGMIMGPVAHALLKEEFGDLPQMVLTQPDHLLGYLFHVPGIGSEKLDNFTPLTWRRNLDYWMIQKAQATGVEVRQGAPVVMVKRESHGFSVIAEVSKQRQEFTTRFLVGADGGNSVIRKLLFPELKMRYAHVYQERYPGEMDLDRKYFHWFYPPEHTPEFFDVHQKDGLIIIDFAGRIGEMDKRVARTRDFLAKKYHFNPIQKPVWKGSCLQPVMYPELTSHTFIPARGNALLVGDAAGLVLPVSGEGIGAGMKSALLAAHSIKTAFESGESAEAVYLSKIEDIICMFGEIYPLFKNIIEEASRGGNSLPQVLRDAYSNTLRAF